EVLEVAAPHRLVQTWKPSWDPGSATKIIYTLEPIDGGTRVTVRHSGFTSPQSCESHGDGWTRVLGWLGAHLTGEERFFLLRLIAPRPTFAQDMNADERAVMQEHAAYLAGRLAAGAVLAFGPVLDPAGAWGMGLVRATDEAEARALTAADPVIVSNRGFRYEILPIARLVY
ncbi:MAG TPA: SRPBCC domain-containing protein, partial [Kofleriaceae bacterium]|nr:SRPBCC domain-containing protein [Kofleriaceae bacterium]